MSQIHSKKNIEVLIVLALSFLGGALGSFWRNDQIGFNWISFLKLMLVLSLLVFARPTKDTRFSFNACLGIILSFFGPLFFEIQLQSLNKLSFILGVSTLAYYFLILILSYLHLGRSFGLFPADRGVQQGGFFSLVRHPIYSAYIHIAIVITFLNLNLRNLFICLMVILGFYLRTFAEEFVLIKNESYQLYKLKVKNRFWTSVLTFPALILLVVTGVYKFLGDGKLSVSQQSLLKLQLAYAALDLNPVYYDDFGSVFIGNQIYPRLLPDLARSELPSVSRGFLFKCVERNKSQCITMRALFKIRELKNCRGEKIDSAQIENEMWAILKQKPWIFPNPKKCKDDSFEICLEGPYINDLQRNFEALYFRFGWSKEINRRSGIRGVAPYCLSEMKWDGNSLIGGLLTKSDQDFPGQKWEFYTDQSSENKFDVALYGSSQLLNESRRNFVTDTPIAYYVITNPAYATNIYPWNRQDSLEVIKDFMLSNDIIFRVPSIGSRSVTNGQALNRSVESKQKLDRSKIVFVIPNYIKRCPELALKLNKLWNGEYAHCENTTALIEKIQKKEPIDWYGFMTPLTPGAPSRNGIATQYFSPFSLESYTGLELNPELFYYLIGIGKSYITVNRQKICSMRSNPLGLGDLITTDFQLCDGSID